MAAQQRLNVKEKDVRKAVRLTEWRPVVGFEEYYEVSSHGDVRSLSDPYGRPRREPLILKPWENHGAYLLVGLHRNGQVERKSIHRLVLEAFSGPCPASHETAHLDGNRTNNRIENLQWVTHTENELHKVLHGTVARGERHGSKTHPERLARGDRNGSRLHPERVVRGERHRWAKLTAQQVLDIRTQANRGDSYTVLMRRFGVSKSTIGDIVNRVAWKSL